MKSSRHQPELSAIDYELITCSKGEKISRTRRVVVVNGIPMYCSTGRNSNLKGTWFPFLGMNGRALKQHSRSWFLKPHGGRLPNHQIEAFYPAGVVSLVNLYVITNDPDNFTDKVKALLGRFGNLQGMAISASFGGGFWDEPEAVKLKAHLQQYYPYLMVENVSRQKCINRTTCEIDTGDDHKVKRHKHREAVAEVNNFIHQQGASPLFFALDRAKRMEVYKGFSQRKEVQVKAVIKSM